MARFSLPKMKLSVLGSAMQSFDKHAAMIVGIVWGAAVVLTILASMGISSALHAREQLAAAEASTPLTPRISQQQLPEPAVKAITDKLAKRYGAVLQIAISAGTGQITITAKDASAFSTWLTAVTYLDIIRPDVAWKIEKFCVGAKCGESLMSASFSAIAVAFEVPTAPM
jgi:hypothetical protein